MLRYRRAAAAAVLLALAAAACSASITVQAPEEGVVAEPTPVPPSTPGEEPPLSEDPENQPGPAEAQEAVWTDGACAFAEPSGVAVECGWLEVPELWDQAGGQTIRLHVGIFSAGPNDTEPIVYLEGGPGADPLANIAQGFDTFFGELVNAHDIVIVGQRGTGAAEPHLQCEQALELSLDLLDAVVSPDEEFSAYEEAYSDCADDFADAGIDTSAYNSIQNAHDVDALRKALGHEQWNVLGVSYGTRLAQTLMRIHPDGLRSVVLDSVLTMERDPSVDLPATAQRAFEQLWDGCTRSVACNGAFPDLEERFFALVDELDVNPLSFEANNVFTGERHGAAIDGERLMEVAFGALYSKSALAGLPELVTQLEQGDTTGAAILVSQKITSEPFVAEGMYWSVECNEEVGFIDQASADAGVTGDPRYDRLRADGYKDFLDTVCAAFDAGTAPAVEDEPVTSTVPTLVLAGAYDPITPPEDGRALLDGLANSFFVEFPHTGHGAVVDACAQQILLAFLAATSTAPAQGCVSEIAEPEWAPDPFTDIAFEEFGYDQGLFSASGVRPVGWDDVGDGGFALSDNLLHTSVILQQVVSEAPRQLFLGSFGAALGTEFGEVEELDAAGRTWTRYEGAAPGFIFDVVITEDDGRTFLVLLQHAPADRDQAVAALLAPILDAIGP